MPTERLSSAPKSVRHVASSAAAGQQEQLVLGIESSCDDTGVAVVSSTGRILGEALVSQAEIHAPWGGVVPNLAMEAHKAAIDQAVQEVLQQAQISASQLDAVAVTQGPGLGLCLRVGFPFLCLLISGGHSLLLVVHGVGDYTLLGGSIDDAVGEAFDKVARMLNLECRPSGGAAIEALAVRGDSHKVPFPMPLKKRKDCSFSYAGLKTAVMRTVAAAALGEGLDADLQAKADIAASFQRVAVEHLAQRCRRAAVWSKAAHPCLSSLVVSGGVERLNLDLWDPPPALEPAQEEDVDIRPRWPLTNRQDDRFKPEKKTMKRSRLHVSLTELTRQQLRQLNMPTKLDAPDRVLSF
ncbi:hypothetical protein WJX73_003849 [Symbiochloris irregularis]|uniref:N(6)-L-threonylcarbamoyladenine synthase n=1 Tax=Symbiochloris irregularis TaxID=706552 RepID=A0AAW1NV12_9CHLO